MLHIKYIYILSLFFKGNHAMLILIFLRLNKHDYSFFFLPDNGSGYPTFDFAGQGMEI